MEHKTENDDVAFGKIETDAYQMSYFNHLLQSSIKQVSSGRRLGGGHTATLGAVYDTWDTYKCNFSHLTFASFAALTWVYPNTYHGDI